MRAGLGIGGALALAAGLGACSRLPEVAVPGAAARATRDQITDRVWLEESDGAAPGSLMVFLSDGTLLMTSCGETWRLVPWRLVEEGRLAWEEDGAILRAEVAVAGGDALALAVDLGNSGTVPRRFRAARAPELCPGD